MSVDRQTPVSGLLICRAVQCGLGTGAVASQQRNKKEREDIIGDIYDTARPFNATVLGFRPLEVFQFISRIGVSDDGLHPLIWKYPLSKSIKLTTSIALEVKGLNTFCKDDVQNKLSLPPLQNLLRLRSIRVFSHLQFPVALQGRYRQEYKATRSYDH